MDKKYVTVIILCLMFGLTFVIAQVALSNHSPDMELSEKATNITKEHNLDDPEKSACITIDENKCQFKMWKVMEATNETPSYTYNLGTHTVMTKYCTEYNQTTNECLAYTNYTEQELKVMVKETGEQWMEDYVDVMTGRGEKQAFNKTELVGSGTFTTKEIN